MMKPVAYILLTLMLFLMAQPVLVMCQAKIKQPVPVTGNAKVASCHKKEKSKKEENKCCDTTAPCNPFASCSQCHYIATSKFFYPGTVLQTGVNNIPTSNERLTSGYISDCFQPPEFVFA